MTVAPTPVFPLCSGVLPVVPTIGPALNHEITPVGVVFAVVPVVVVAVVPIADPGLRSGILRFWPGHSYRWCGKSSPQKQQAEVSIAMTQDVFLPFGDLQIQSLGSLDNALLTARWMFQIARNGKASSAAKPTEALRSSGPCGRVIQRSRAPPFHIETVRRAVAVGTKSVFMFNSEQSNVTGNGILSAS